MSSSKLVFHENFMNFFQKPNISQNIDFEKGKHEWISICNTTEPTMYSCVCGHKVKNITYLFNEKNQNIVSVGTTCCKKYGLLEKHMKNELLIHILREQISQHCFKHSGKILSLEKDLGELLENYIYEKFTGIMKQYSRDMDENIFYFDVFYPLNRMKDDILELKTYGYDFNKYYNEICQILREREIHINEMRETEDTDSETNSEIMEKLDKIEQEISELLNENLSENEESDLEENEEISELLNENLEEKDLEENLRIEEEIKKEAEEETSKKEAEEYLENEEREIQEKVTHYIERNIENIYTNYEPKYTERELRLKLGIHELNMRIEYLRRGIEEYKRDYAIFDANLQQFKNEIEIFNSKYK